MELKVVADVGLVGKPNAGKSTLLARLSDSKPKIADYPFTTLKPNLGIVAVEGWRSFVLADIPGLIEDAHQGKGLGLDFLRHVERCRVIVLVIDPHVEDVVGDLRSVMEEMRAYGRGLPEKESMIALNKGDLGRPSKEVIRAVEELGLGPVVLTSGVSGSGLAELKTLLMSRVERMRDADIRAFEAPRGAEEEEQWRP
jgi:GTP-binding protein